MRIAHVGTRKSRRIGTALSTSPACGECLAAQMACFAPRPCIELLFHQVGGDNVRKESSLDLSILSYLREGT